MTSEARSGKSHTQVQKTKNNKRMVCFAHRGASGHAPENTLAAFTKAVELGADWIELDVYAVQNELVVIHDNRLERTTNGCGYVTRHDLAYLRKLDAGGGEKIPFLSEVLDATERQVKVNIELKGPQTADPACALVDHYVQNRGWQYHDFLLSSFDHNQLRRARERCSEIPVAPNLKTNRLRYGDWDKTMRPYSIHCDRAYTTPALIDRIHRLHCPAFVFTVNDPQGIKQLDSIGVDGVFTNFPELVTRYPG